MQASLHPSVSVHLLRLAARFGVGIFWCGGALLATLPPPAQAITYTVDPAGGADFTTIPEAIAAADDGDTVLLAPGDYLTPPDGLDLEGKAITLTSSAGAASTVLYADFNPTVLRLHSGEGPDTRIQGITLSFATSSALVLENVSPTFDDIIFEYNTGLSDRPGVAASITGGAPSFSNLILRYNTGFGDGCGITAVDSELEIQQAQFLTNYGLGFGTGIYLVRSNLTLTDATFFDNYGGGGSLALFENSDALLTRVNFLDNQGIQAAGIYVDNSQLSAANLLASGQYGLQHGFLYCHAGTLKLTHATVVGNAAPEGGAAIYGVDCEGVFTNSLFVDNRAAQGGVLKAVVTTPVSEEDSTPTESPTPEPTPFPLSTRYTFSYCNFLRNGPSPIEGAEAPTQDVFELEPRFQYYLEDLKSAGDDYHLLVTSPLRDLGNPDPAFLDTDGTRADIGVTGGPAAELSWGQDADADGLPDGWEAARLSDPATQMGSSDPDDDGLSTLSEYNLGLLPEEADTDGDTVSDGEELNRGTDPRNTFNPNPVLILPTARFPTLQSGINVATDGAVLELSPGAYIGSHNLLGKALTVRGSGSPDAVVVEAEEGVRVFTIELGEDNRTVLEGFTITGGSSSTQGGGLLVRRSAPTLSRLIVEGNLATEDGGGLAVLDASLRLQDITFTGNGSSTSGGAISALRSDVLLENCRIDANSALTGGGISVVEGRLTLSQSHLSLNSQSALYAKTSQVLVDESVIEGNSATYGSAIDATDSDVKFLSSTVSDNLSSTGAAVSMERGTLALERTLLRSNLSTGAGGALLIRGPAAVTANTVLIHNNEAAEGGGLYFAGDVSAVFEQVSVVGNLATVTGGAVWQDAGTSTFLNSIISFNVSPGAGSFTFLPDATSTLRYSNVFGNRSSQGDDGTSVWTEVAPVAGDPHFVSFTDDLKAGGDDFHLQPSSPLIDAGDPASAPDPDGSPADLGYYGGILADFTYYADSDGDGMQDGWETQVGLDPAVQDGALDPDGDGLSNVAESQASTDPLLADTDNDGLADAQELDAGSAPDNAFDPPGRVKVPTTFASIQAAIDAAPALATFEVLAGEYPENIDFLGKHLEVSAPDGPGETHITGQTAGSLVTFRLGESAPTRLSGFTLSGGTAANGGGLLVIDASPALANLIIRDNVSSSSGGGVYIRGNPSFTDVQILGNQAGEGATGGGIYLASGTPSFRRLLVAGNVAQTGGGLYVASGSPLFENALLAGNQAALGGGAAVSGADSHVEFVSSTFHANSSGGGAGLVSIGATVKVRSCQITGNTGPVGAGVLSREDGIVQLSYSNVWSNHGSNYSIETPDQTGFDGNVSQDPHYESFSDDGIWSNDDLHLRPDSPLRTAGAPDLLNSDGSPSEPGVYGGPYADRIYYQDLDQDGMYDGWEDLRGLNSTRQDGNEDPDSDTLNNLAEFEIATHPQRIDSDGDSLLDPDEVLAGSDPTDFFSPNATVLVTDFFDSIQEALNAARDGVTLEVSEGVYKELLDFRGKAVTLRAIGRPEKTVLDGAGSGPVVVFRSGEPRETVLEGFSITGGFAPDGGGIRIFQSSPTLHRLIVAENQAENTGGGISASYSNALISNSLIVSNTAKEGGGIAGRSSSFELIHLTVAYNTVTGGGAGVSCIEICSPTLLNSIVSFNTGSNSGGINIILPGVLVFENNDVFQNLPTDYNGIVSQTGRKGNISVNPLFVNGTAVYEDADFQLLPESPCVDGGQDVSKRSIPEDIHTVPRPFDGNQDGSAEPDMGAYEYEFDVDGDHYLVSEGDCDEGESAHYPGAPETCEDGVDQDCDGEDLSCRDQDQDGDGMTENQGDCDDSRADVALGLEELDDGVDNNCDGVTDEGFETPTPEVSQTPEPGADGCACQQRGTRSPGGIPVGRLGLLLLGGILMRRGRRVLTTEQHAGQQKQ